MITILISGIIVSIQRESWLNFFCLTKMAVAATILALVMFNLSKMAVAATILALVMFNLSKIFATRKLCRHNFSARDLVLIFIKAWDGLVYRSWRIGYIITTGKTFRGVVTGGGTPIILWSMLHSWSTAFLVTAGIYIYVLFKTRVGVFYQI